MGIFINIIRYLSSFNLCESRFRCIGAERSIKNNESYANVFQTNIYLFDMLFTFDKAKS